MDSQDTDKYLKFGTYTEHPPQWLMDKVVVVDNSIIDEEYVKKILRIIDAEFDPTQYKITKTNDLKQSRFITVTDILRLRQDSCGSLATVVASVLRTLGIPTKLIHGRFIDDSTNILHAWNEVLIAGKWIPFDIKGKKRGISSTHHKEKEMVDWDEMEGNLI